MLCTHFTKMSRAREFQTLYVLPSGKTSTLLQDIALHTEEDREDKKGKKKFIDPKLGTLSHMK